MISRDNNMRKIIKTMFLCLLAAAVLFSCVTKDENEWNEIKDSEYVEDILGFAQNYSGGELIFEINKKIKDMISFEENVEKLNFLIENYPEKSDEFKNRIAELALIGALEENTYDSLGGYIAEFEGYAANSAYINEAKSVLKNMYLNAAKAENSVVLFEEFIRMYEKENEQAVLEAADALDEIYWDAAQSGGNKQDYENYIAQANKINAIGVINYNYEAKYILEAHKILEEFKWADALAAHKAENIILPLLDFIELYPDSAYISEAEEIIEQIRGDSGYSDKYLYNGATLDTIDEFILNFPGHKDIDKAIELRGDFIGDIYSLWLRGYIALVAVGDSITRSRIIIESRTDSKLIINISYGVYLEANSGNVQNMLVREEVEFVLNANQTRYIYINTLCMNIFRDIPDSTNYFTVGMLDEKSPLINLLKTLEATESEFEVAQAAVWHITDNPGKDRILNTIIYQDGTDAITEEIYSEALRIIELAGNIN